MFPKTFRVLDTVEWRWKIVPGKRTDVWVYTLADLSATTRLLSGVGGSQTGPHLLVDGDGTHHVGKIRRTLTGVEWVHHGAPFEVHSTVDEQPVELPQSWCHVLVQPSVENQPRCCMHWYSGTLFYIKIILCSTSFALRIAIWTAQLYNDHVTVAFTWLL